MVFDHSICKVLVVFGCDPYVLLRRERVLERESEREERECCFLFWCVCVVLTLPTNPNNKLSLVPNWSSTKFTIKPYSKSN